MTESAIRHLDTLPVDSDAEMSVLCWLLTEQFYRNDSSQGSAREFFYTENLRGELFWIDKHRTIFNEIERRMTAEPPEVIDAFLMQSAWDDLPTRSLAVELCSPAYCTSKSSAMNATARLRTAFKLRQLATMGNRVMESATNPEANPDEIIEGAESVLSSLRNQGRSGLIAYSEAAKETMTEILATKQARIDGRVIGIPSGIRDLDECLGGARPGELITIAARPGEGKSALAIKWLDSGAELGKRENFHSLEMGVIENLSRHLAMRALVDHERIRMGYITGEDIGKLHNSAADVANFQVWVNARRPQTPAVIRADIFRTRPDIVIVDYLQILNSNIGISARMTREREISEMTAGLKGLAMEFRIPIIMLSQLNREVEKRQSREPQLSDLRESGGIEQDSDVVVFIYRESDDITDMRTIKVAKHRNGPRAKFDVRFAGEYLRFDNLEKQAGDYYRDH